MSLTRDQVDTLTEPDEIAEESTDSGSVRHPRVWHIAVDASPIGYVTRALCGLPIIVEGFRPPGEVGLCVMCKIIEGA